MDSDDEGESSVFGRHDHWEEVYTRELINLRQHGDQGEVWFGDAVLQTTADFAHQQASLSSSTDVATARVLDVGTGNGTLALELCKRGFQHVTGSDYSIKSIELAKAVAQQAREQRIEWVTDDILATQLQTGWDMIVDKGTLDAIGLRSDAASARVQYRTSVQTLLRPGGLLVITSCNSSKDELISEFTCSRPGTSGASHGVFKAADDVAAAASVADSKHVSGCASAGRHDSCAQFDYVDHVRSYPVLRFGGQEGSRVCTVAFRTRTEG